MPTSFLRRLVPLALTAAWALNGASAAWGEQHSREISTTAAEVKHVFVIVLENKSYSDTFGASTQDPYLQHTLVPMGGLLTQYYGTGHVSLDNYISLISGQSPTPDTDNDCLPGFTGTIGNYNNVKQMGAAPQGQVIASGGCIYPKNVKTLPNQLEEAGLTWRGYMGDMGNDPARESAAWSRWQWNRGSRDNLCQWTARRPHLSGRLPEDMGPPNYGVRGLQEGRPADHHLR